MLAEQHAAPTSILQPTRDCCRQHTLRYRQLSAQASHCMKRCPSPGTAGNPAQRPHSAYWKEASGRGGGSKPRCAQPREGSRAVRCKLVWVCSGRPSRLLPPAVQQGSSSKEEPKHLQATDISTWRV